MNKKNINFVVINQCNIEILENLSQAYEAEFSNLTNKIPDEFGRFEIDTLPRKPYIGYLLYVDNIPAGFCIVDIESKIKDIAEFYIIPAFRKKNLGYQLAATVFCKHPGRWKVRQIKGAVEATLFWRRVIEKYTNNRYEEFILEDECWGEVTCQEFQTKNYEI